MNKYSEEEQRQIIELSAKGLSSRKIAKILDRSKSGINYFLGRNSESKVSEEVVIPSIIRKEIKPKILFLDVETAASIAAVFGRFKQNISHDAVIIEGGWLLSYAAKWYNKDEILKSVLTPSEAVDCNDVRLCTELFDLLEQADYVVWHNGDNFDKPVIKTRMLLNKLPAIRKIRSIDTLTLAKEFRFNSNRLDALCKQLEQGRKVKHDGISLWIACQNGNQEALNKMLEYNVGDIPTLEALYLELRNHSTRHPNLAVHYGDKIRCNICCSDNITETSNTSTTNLSVFAEYQCNDCNARFRDRKAKTTKEERSHFLSN